jgi:hypothetical protein
MHYMVIEHFKEGAVPEVYRRLAEKGRMMPDGLEYISSWIDYDLKTCWQVMRTEDPALFDRWLENWKDLFHYEIIPVHSSAEMVHLMSHRKS